MVVAAAILVSGALWAGSPVSPRQGLRPEQILHEAQLKEQERLAGEQAGGMATFAPVTILSSGGPDAFGYTYIDSNEFGGPAFDWVDISGTGTPTLGGSDDDHVYPVPIGFAFTFYGTPFTQAAVGSNGHVYFQDAYLGLSNVCIPGDPDYDVKDNIIAAYWDDLVISPGSVYYQTLGSAGSRRFVVMFSQVRFFGSSVETPLSFEVILNEADNSILLQYLHASTGSSGGRDNGGSATVGIQQNVSAGLQYSCNTQSLSDGLAILFSLGTTYSMIFEDDATGTQVCINPETGDFRWSIMLGDFIVASYEGTLNVYNGGTMFWSQPGAPQYVYVYYDPNNHRAWGYLYDYSTYVYSSLFDSNTLDNPEACADTQERFLRN